jgi:methionyl-tRNA formyltransferase
MCSYDQVFIIRLPICAGFSYNSTMSVTDRSRAALRILFLGLPAGVSALVLRKLLDETHHIVGVVVPASSVPHLLFREIQPVSLLEPHFAISLPLNRVMEESNTLSVAWSAGLPIWAINDINDPGTKSLLYALDIDVACVACYTHRIPPAILQLPRFGFLNMHPSLLPAYRGPVPRFWQLRDGAITGITIHYLDEGLDTGDIVVQARVDLPEGIDGPDVDRRLTLAGFDLLQGVLQDLSLGFFARRPQSDGGTYFGLPGADDFSLSTEWPARQAFNFMRGTADWGFPYHVTLAGRTAWLDHTTGYEAMRRLPVPYQIHGEHIAINFTPGVLHARLANRASPTKGAQ